MPLLPPDVEAHVISELGSALDAVVTNLKPAATSTAHRHVVVRADLQNRASSLTQYARLGLSAYVMTGVDSEDLPAAFALANDAARLVLRSRGSWLVHAEVQSGPARVFDTPLKREFAYSTLLLEVALTL